MPRSRGLTPRKLRRSVLNFRLLIILMGQSRLIRMTDLPYLPLRLSATSNSTDGRTPPTLPLSMNDADHASVVSESEKEGGRGGAVEGWRRGGVEAWSGGTVKWSRRGRGEGWMGGGLEGWRGGGVEGSSHIFCILAHASLNVRPRLVLACSPLVEQLRP